MAVITTIDREHLPRGEYYALLLFALAGMMLMATATDLLVIFLALEVLSIAVYVLTGIRRDSPVSAEAAFKYFLLGAFSSAFFLYGIALSFLFAGSTRLDTIGSAMATSQPPLIAILAIGLPAVGFCFKVLAVLIFAPAEPNGAGDQSGQQHEGYARQAGDDLSPTTG